MEKLKFNPNILKCQDWHSAINYVVMIRALREGLRVSLTFSNPTYVNQLKTYSNYL